MHSVASTTSRTIPGNMPGNTWALATKQVGDIIAGWVVSQRHDGETKILEKSERCEVTSFCYPAGAKLVRVQLERNPLIDSDANDI